MKKVFKDPIEVKKQYPKNHPKDGKQSLGWDSTSPDYDQRSSGFIKAGTCYGVGYNQPTGQFNASAMRNDVIPSGSKVVNITIPENE